MSAIQGNNTTPNRAIKRSLNQTTKPTDKLDRAPVVLNKLFLCLPQPCLVM